MPPPCEGEIIAVRYTSSGINSALIFDKLGRSYFGTSNETTLLPRFEAAVFAHESSTGKHAIVGRHFSGTGSVFRGYQGLDIATLTTDIKADGTAKFATLDVSNVLTSGGGVDTY